MATKKPKKRIIATVAAPQPNGAPGLPKEIIDYLKDECCDPGIVKLNNFLTMNPPEKSVAAVLAIIRTKLAKAKRTVDADIKHHIERLEQERSNIELLTGKPVEVKVNR